MLKWLKCILQNLVGNSSRVTKFTFKLKGLLFIAVYHHSYESMM